MAKFPCPHHETSVYNPKLHLLAFVDALGFAKVVETEKEKIKRYFEIIEQSLEIWRAFYSERQEVVKMTNIGDAAIFAIEVSRIEDTDCVGLQLAYTNRLAHLCNVVASVQNKLACEDIWTRGAITCGELHFSQERIVGPAFHKAYFLEQKVARYPRIILDGSVIKESGHLTCAKLIERPELASLLIKTSSGGLDEFPSDIPAFVNFFPQAGTVDEKIDWVSSVVLNVNKRLKADVQHYAKYKWVATYLLRNITSSNELIGARSAKITDAERILWDS